MSGPILPAALEASRCGSCGKHVIPRRPRCPICGGATQNVTVEATGSILTWTTVHVTPEGVPSPRTVALVGLDCGAAVLCLVEGPKEPAIGMRVVVACENGLNRIV